MVPDAALLPAYTLMLGLLALLGYVALAAGVKAADRAPKQVADDTAGLYYLRAASAFGVPVLTGFVNSAPPQFTTNGKACGGNLKPGMEAAYAQYLAETGKVPHPGGTKDKSDEEQAVEAGVHRADIVANANGRPL